MAGILLGVTAEAVNRTGQAEAAGVLIRPGYGQESEERQIYVEGLAAEGTIPVTVNLSGRTYSEEEANEAYGKLLELLPQQIKGDNPSLDEVRSNLNLISGIGELGIRLRWESTRQDLVDAFGEVHGEGVPEEGERLDLRVEMWDGAHSEQFLLPVRVLPPDKNPLEERIGEFLMSVSQADLQQQNTPWLRLPGKFEGAELRYHTPEEPQFFKMTALGIFCALLLTYKERSDAERAKKQRENQLLLDYPEVVSKLMIFLGAGMTVRTAWERIAGDYQIRQRGGNLRPRPAYEEMYETCCQMKRGVPEGQAYEEFGRRCGLAPYMKLCTLLEQNRKNGSKNLRERLHAEMAEAFELRKHGARRMGEEAATRLLLPLFMMLGVVMVMVAVPALMEFM